MTGSYNVEVTTVEHCELSFLKCSDAFNAQDYGIFATNLRNAKIPCVLLNKAKKRQLHHHVAHNHISVKSLIYYIKFKIYGMITVHISYGCT